MPYDFDPELAPVVELLPAIGLDDLDAARAAILDMVRPMNEQVDVTGVDITDHQVGGVAGAPDVLVRVYAPAERARARA